MSARQYGAIVVGARCAGSPTAMLLARKVYEVPAIEQAMNTCQSTRPSVRVQRAESVR